MTRFSHPNSLLPTNLAILKAKGRLAPLHSSLRQPASPSHHYSTISIPQTPKRQCAPQFPNPPISRAIATRVPPACEWAPAYLMRPALQPPARNRWEPLGTTEYGTAELRNLQIRRGIGARVRGTCCSTYNMYMSARAVL